MGGTPAFLQWPTRGFLERVSRVSRYPTCTAWYPFFSLVSTCRHLRWWLQWLKAAPCHTEGFVAIKRLYAQRGPRPQRFSIATLDFATPQHHLDGPHLHQAATDPGAAISALPRRRCGHPLAPAPCSQGRGLLQISRHQGHVVGTCGCNCPMCWQQALSAELACERRQPTCLSVPTAVHGPSSRTPPPQGPPLAVLMQASTGPLHVDFDVDSGGWLACKSCSSPA